MKAIVQDRYGSPDLLQLREVEIPRIDDELPSLPPKTSSTRLLQAAVLSKFVSQRLVPFISQNDGPGLALLKELAEAGKIRPTIDRQYALSEAAEAIRNVGAGHARGKVIIKVPLSGS